MNAESNLITVPLSRLQLSQRNVRKTGGATIEDLAASIHAHGLGQNLIVTRDAGDAYAVEAGGRRLKALQLLASDGRLAADFAVPCKLVPIEQAAEVSLAENQLREAMHPADQFQAIKSLVDSGLDEGEVAARFGVTRLFVRQRMKLAKVSPKIIDDYRAGKTTLDIVEVCALTDDIPRQERTYKQAAGNSHYLRQLLTKGEVPASDRRVAFVGLAAYEAAGGPVHRDMFDPENGGYVTDVKLLDKLVAERLEAETEKLRGEGWGWVETAFTLEEWRFPPNHEKKGDKAKFGALVHVDYRGNLQVDRWRMKPGQRTGKPAAAKKDKPRDAAALSADMVTRLELHRAAAIRLQVAASPKTALQLLLLEMVLRTGFTVRGGGMSWADSSLSATDQHSRDGSMARGKFDDLAKSPARAALQARIDKWQAAIAGDKTTSTAERILALNLEQQLELLALCFALTLERNGGDTGAKLAASLGIDMAQWWAPNPETFLEVVPKPVLAAAVADVAGKAAGEQLLSLKKDAAIAAAAKHLAGTGWLPKPLRGKAYAVTAKAAGNQSTAPAAPKKAANQGAAKRAATTKPAGAAKKNPATNKTNPKKPAVKKPKKTTPKRPVKKGKR